MDAQTLTFTANEQVLTKTDSMTEFASNTVSYIEATFTLGTNWTGYDAVRAVWKTDYYTISTVLDGNYTCVVPTEVLMYKAKVYVNLVGSITSGDTLTDRLTTFPVLALTVTQKAQVDSTETTTVTASQFDQFVATVQTEAASIQNYSHDSEAWAVGTRGGVAVTSGDDTYENNSKYWAQEAASELSDLKDDLSTTSELLGIDNDNLITSISLGYYTNDGNYSANSSFSYSNAIDVSTISTVAITGNLHIYTLSQFPAVGVFLDSDNALVATIYDLIDGDNSPSQPWIIDVPSGATTLYINTDYKASDYVGTIPSGLFAYEISNPVAFLNDLSDGRKIKIIAGVIRNDGNGWAYINDSGHEPLNLSAVSVDANGRIQIDYGFTATKVLSLVATPDETFASLYTIGGSVGLTNTLFNVYTLPKTYGGMVRVNNGVFNATSYASFSSVTVQTNGEIRLYHTSLSGISSKEIFNIQASSPSYSIILGSQGFDYISLYAYDANGQKITDFTGLSFDIYATRTVNAVFVDANDIADAGGNFWIYGVMEI